MTELVQQLAPLQLKKPSRVRLAFLTVAIVVLRAVVRIGCYVAPGPTARLLERLLTSPRRFPASSRERALTESADPIELEVQGKTLQGWIWGATNPGPLVVLVHGWEGRGSQLAALADPLVSRGYRVVTWDVHGHGRSPGRRATVFDFAEALLAAERQLGSIDVVVAHSFGCTGTAFALRCGLETSRVVFFAPPISLKRGTRYWARLLGVTDHVLQRMRDSMENRSGVRWSELEMRNMAPDMGAELLIIHDELDRQVQVDAARELVELWPGARLKVTRGLGHHRILRDHASVGSAIEFIAF